MCVEDTPDTLRVTPTQLCLGYKSPAIPAPTASIHVHSPSIYLLSSPVPKIQRGQKQTRSLPSELPRGPVGPHTGLCTFPLSPAHTVTPHLHSDSYKCTQGLTNTNTHLQSHSELGGCMHTRAHTWRLGVSRAPVWCLGVPMGLCQLHPPALMQSPGPRGGLHHPGAQWSAQMWANRQRVCTRGCTPGMVPGPGLCWALILYLPEQLFTPCPLCPIPPPGPR